MTEAERVQGYLRTVAAGASDAGWAGGFSLSIRGHDPSPHANYAVPAATDGLDLAALAEAFAAHGRAIRLEWVAEYAPGLEAAAVAAGLELELRTPVMTCPAGSRRAPPRVDGLVVVGVPPDAPTPLLRELIAVQEEGFGVERVEVGDADVAFLRRVLSAASLGRIEGEPAGAAALNRIHDGLAEVVGVATRPAFRGRGVAAALVADVAAQGFALGADLLLLTPGDAGARRLYARAGFADALTMLHYRAP